MLWTSRGRADLLERRSIYRRGHHSVQIFSFAPLRKFRKRAQLGTSSADGLPTPRYSDMSLLFRYLRGYWPLVALALVLAAINQVFSLLDPLIFRHVIDDYATKHDQYTNGQFFRGVTLLLGDGRRRRVRLPRRKELPGLLRQRRHATARRAALLRRHSSFAVRCPSRSSRISAAARRSASCKRSAADTEKFISAFVNIVFTIARRRDLRHDLRLQRPLVDRPRVPAHHSAARRPQLRAEQTNQDDSESHRRRDDRARRRHDGIPSQHRAREEPRARRAGDQPAQRDDRQDSQARAQEGPIHPQPELHPGDVRELRAHRDPVPDAVPDLRQADHGRPVLLVAHLFILHLRPAPGARERHQHYRETEASLETFQKNPRDADRPEARDAGGGQRSPCARLRRRELHAPDRVRAGAVGHLVSASNAARPWRSSDPRAPARRHSSSCSSVSTSRRPGRVLYNGVDSAPRRSRPASASASAS